MIHLKFKPIKAAKVVSGNVCSTSPIRQSGSRVQGIASAFSLSPKRCHFRAARSLHIEVAKVGDLWPETGRS